MATRSSARVKADRALSNVRRDRKMMTVTAVIALASAGGLVGYFDRSQPEPPPAIVMTAVDDAKPLTLTFAGDTMLGDGAQEVIATHGLDHPLAAVRRLLTGDVVVVNAEAPMSETAPPANPGAKYSYGTSPEAAGALRRAGVDVLDLGNNHVMDRGAEGLAATDAAAEAAGLTTFGAGRTLDEAIRPLIVTKGDERVALVSFGENFGAQNRAGAEAPGMVPMTLERVEQAYQAAVRNGATRVVAVVHWGDNYAPVVAQQRYWAQVFADARYDAVIGHGSHTVQEVASVDGMPVAYGLGNFVFGAPGRFDTMGVPGTGLVAHLSFTADGGELSLDCIETDNETVAYQPRPCAPEAQRYTAEVTGPAVTWPTQGPGRMTW